MTASEILLTAVSVTFLIMATLTPSALGIRCYQCNSLSEEGCQTIVPTNATDSPYLHECQAVPGQTMFCRKIVQKIEAFGVEKKILIRKCSYEKSEKDCYHFEDEDHSEDVCQCFSDACNRGDRGMTPSSIWKTMFSVATITVASSFVARVI